VSPVEYAFIFIE